MGFFSKIYDFMFGGKPVGPKESSLGGEPESVVDSGVKNTEVKENQVPYFEDGPKYPDEEMVGEGELHKEREENVHSES